NFGNSGRGIYLDSMRGSEKRGFRYMPEHKAALEWKPDIVICNLGINDNGEYIKEYTGGRRRGQFEGDYLALLEDYRKANPKAKFAIWTKLSPLAEGQRFYRSPEPFLMQADLESVAKKMNAVGLDMQEPLREKMDEIFARDKIHPNAEGAHIIAGLTFAKLFTKQFPCALMPDIDSLVSLPRQVEDAPHEIWLCAGQSNMQKGWNEFNATPQEKERVKGEMARLAKCQIWFWDFNDGKWTKLSPENAIRKSAFGVSFAIRRAEATGKAIAMLYVAAGGAPTESFLSEQTMCALGKDGKPLYPHLAAIATNRHRLDKNKDFSCAWVAREYPRRRNNMEEGHWWPVSLMYDKGIKRIKDGKPLYPHLAAIATNRHRLDQNKDFPCAWVAREYPRRRANKEEAYWWPVSKMYDNGIKRLKDGNITVDGILWYQGESNATTCVAPDKPTDRDYQLETLRALVSELRGDKKVPFVMMGLPKMDRPWEQYRAVQREICDETGAIFVDTFAAGLGEMNDVHPRDKTAFADLAAKSIHVK
ncbi:MAG: hypothetical protein IKO55_04800, partial [Kiritimatiellae bacterium]|nr:hypothetical protein [Kiritimatiellia bacterium]